MSLMVQHHSDTTTRLDDMITREEWDSAVAYMNEEKGRNDLRRENGTVVFEKAARAGAPLRFFKQGLRQIGEHKSKAIRAATGWIEEGTEQWLFLLDHESSGKVEQKITTATLEFEKALDEWSHLSREKLESALFELDQWGFTDSELLNITLGDKEDIPFFLRTCLLGEFFDEEANPIANTTILFISEDLKQYFADLAENRAFEDALVGGFKGVCTSLIDTVEWFATQTDLEGKEGEVEQQRHNLFAALQQLHAEFNALLRAELQNDRDKRDEVFGDIALMGEEQQHGVVRNRVLSGVGGESSKFWAMESYKRSIMHQSTEDCKRSDREIQRLKLAIDASKLPLKHKTTDYELKGEQYDMTDNESVLLTKAEGAYNDLIKVEEIRKNQSLSMAARAETYTDMNTQLVKEVELFLKLHKVLEKEESQLHHFFRNEEKLQAIREKRDKIIVKLERRIIKK
ncbi:hypothetical protein TL16_g05396 [Triparma laevis f. inornata]|uniref:Uncharacterized protein n=1 Tax=Triparma laevis f. inornata TaxID=1714386 RepID=A0A9W7ADM7_9STRA|nr:hypothetical protein TL16_g05396 [Triparma laevis f. inornata]